MQVNGEIRVSSRRIDIGGRVYRTRGYRRLASPSDTRTVYYPPNHIESQDPRIRAAAETARAQAIAGQSDDASSAQIEGGDDCRQVGKFGCFGMGEWTGPTSPGHVAQDHLDRLNARKKGLQKRAQMNEANAAGMGTGLTQEANLAKNLAEMAADESIKDSVRATELAIEEVQNIANKKAAAATKNASEKQEKRDAMNQAFVGAVRAGDYPPTIGGERAAIQSLIGADDTGQNPASGRFKLVEGAKGMNYVVKKSNHGEGRIFDQEWVSFISSTAAVPKKQPLKSRYQASIYSPSGRGYAGVQSPNNPQSYQSNTASMSRRQPEQGLWTLGPPMDRGH